MRQAELRRARYLAKHDEILAYHRQWYRDHAESQRARTQRWRERNPERAAAQGREWAKRNPEKARAITHRNNVRRRTQVRAVKIAAELLTAKWNYWGGRCWMCGCTADTWDHVKPLSIGGTHCLPNLRPACRSCNSSKHAAWRGVSALPEFQRAAA